jgi:hypothetical protein
MSFSESASIATLQIHFHAAGQKVLIPSPEIQCFCLTPAQNHPMFERFQPRITS